MRSQDSESEQGQGEVVIVVLVVCVVDAVRYDGEEADGVQGAAAVSAVRSIPTSSRDQAGQYHVPTSAMKKMVQMQ